MKNYRLLTLPLLLMASASMAQTISEGEALDKALQFKTAGRNARGTVDQPKVSLAFKAAAQDETYFYVYNYADGGFVIVGGDKAAHEILGYADEGQFEYDKLPDGLRWMLSSYERQISAAIRDVKAGVKSIADDANRTDGPRKAPAASVAPLFGADGSANAIAWNQSKPYNLAIDEGKGYYLTGCTATAGGQVMRYYRYPSQDTGIRFERQYLGTVSGTDCYCPASTSDFIYNWSSINPSYTGSSYSLDNEYVKYTANLLYRLGRKMEVNFGTSSTSGKLSNMGKVMVNNFKYDKAMLHLFRSDYTLDADWEKMIIDELMATHPVILGGQVVGGEGGHAFVCDGYNATDNTFHINWGWSGSYNGYFKMSGYGALKPNGTGNGGGAANASYARDMEALVGIQPITSTQNSAMPPLFTSDYTIDKDYYARYEELNWNGRIENSGFQDFVGSIGFMYVNVENPSDVTYDNLGSTTLPSGYGYDQLLANIPNTLTVGKRYYVYPVYKASTGSSNWQMAVHPSSITIPVITITDQSGTPAKGDANYDGRINVGDVITTRAYLNGKNPYPFETLGADMNNDGKVTDADVENMRTKILGQ